MPIEVLGAESVLISGNEPECPMGSVGTSPSLQGMGKLSLEPEPQERGRPGEEGRPGLPSSVLSYRGHLTSLSPCFLFSREWHLMVVE